MEDVKEVEKKTRLAVYKAMQEAVEASMDIAAMILKDEGKLPKEEYKVDFAFLEKDENVLEGELNNRSDRDFCVVAPEIRDIGEMRSLLKKIYVNLDVVGKKYDV